MTTAQGIALSVAGLLLAAALVASRRTTRWVLLGALALEGILLGLERLGWALREHLLTVLLALPALGAVAVLFLPRQWPGVIRRFSMGVLLAELGLSLALLRGDYGTGAFQFVEQHAWIPRFGISYKVGVDGISLWLVLLTTLLTPIALFGSWTGIRHKVKEYAFAFLLLEVGMLGAFVALDLFLFYVFWEVMLVPMALIIGVWGGPRRVYASVKFFLYTLVGSVVMLVAILYLVVTYERLAGQPTFDWEALSRLVFPYRTQLWLLAAFGLAFAVKVPMVPLHTWLPDAHVEAPTGGSVILAGVLLKLGTYGLLRFAMPLAPLAVHEMAPRLLVPLSVAAILYGAWCAWVQRDVKKLVAYSSVAHMGFVTMGLLARTETAVQGAVLQMLNHGVSTGALFLLVGVIYERLHTRRLDAFGGLARAMPWYAVLFVVVAMSSIGLPGTNGFVGEFMILMGTFASGVLGPGAGPFAWVAALGVVFAAVYMLHAVLKTFWGPLPERLRGIADVGWREAVTLLPLVALVFAMGLLPGLFLRPMQASVRQTLAHIEGVKLESVRLQQPKLLPRGRFVRQPVLGEAGGSRPRHGQRRAEAAGRPAVEVQPSQEAG